MNKPTDTTPPGEELSDNVPAADGQRDRAAMASAAQRRRQQLFESAYLATPPARRQRFYEAMKNEWT